jgi:hypothetical protein
MKTMVSGDTEDFTSSVAPCATKLHLTVEHQADKELFSELQCNQFCYVSTARQMGKSSLMLRTAARFRGSGISVAVHDPTAIGHNLTPEQ